MIGICKKVMYFCKNNVFLNLFPLQIMKTNTMNSINPVPYLCELADYVNKKQEYLPAVLVSTCTDDFSELTVHLTVKHVAKLQNQS